MCESAFSRLSSVTRETAALVSERHSYLNIAVWILLLSTAVPGGTQWRSWLRHCATSWPHYGPGIDSASNRNEYQECFLWGKGGRCVGLTTLPPSCASCLEIWEPQPPEPSGPVLACKGIALPLQLSLRILQHTQRINRSLLFSRQHIHYLQYFVEYFNFGDLVQLSLPMFKLLRSVAFGPVGLN